MRKTKGRNADRHLCESCQYRVSERSNASYKYKCEYILKSNPRHSRGCAVEDCDKYVKGKPLKAKDDIRV